MPRLTIHQIRDRARAFDRGDRMGPMRSPILIVLAAMLGCRGDASSSTPPPTRKAAPGAEVTAPAATDSPDPASGHAVLDRYAAGLRTLVQTAEPGAVSAAMAADDTEIRKLADEGAVSAELRDRVLRLFEATRAFVAPARDDAARKALQDTLDAFVLAVNGPDSQPDPNGGMASYVPVFREEVLSLHMLLDGSTDRDSARARYMKEP